MFNIMKRKIFLVCFADLSKETPWKSLKGDYVNVSIFTLPGRSNLAPLGMSKYTHLNDGSLDLILVKNTERREFVRYLRRHGNHKNQVGFKHCNL